MTRTDLLSLAGDLLNLASEKTRVELSLGSDNRISVTLWNELLWKGNVQVNTYKLTPEQIINATILRIEEIEGDADRLRAERKAELLKELEALS